MESLTEFTVEAHFLPSLAASDSSRLLLGKVTVRAKNASHARALAAGRLRIPEVYWRMPQARVEGDMRGGRRGQPIRIVDLRVSK